MVETSQIIHTINGAVVASPLVSFTSGGGGERPFQAAHLIPTFPPINYAVVACRPPPGVLRLGNFALASRASSSLQCLQ
jgi:hypothetical protein